MSLPADTAPLDKPYLRVLVVENHADTRDFLASMLQGLGHTVVAAGSMNEALRAAPRARCDVLVSDIGLPDGTGWDLLSRLDLPRPMYAIAMSGYGSAADQSRSRAVGYRHHLVKPMGLDQLEHILRAVAQQVGRSRFVRRRSRKRLEPRVSTQ